MKTQPNENVGGKPEPAEPPTSMSVGMGRQSARGVLQDRIMGLRRQADELQVLSDALPLKLTPEQDDAIWAILINLALR